MSIRRMRRMVWRHTDSGSIPIMGEGLASNTRLLSEEDADWLNSQFPTLRFSVQEFDGDDWVRVGKGDNDEWCYKEGRVGKGDSDE